MERRLSPLDVLRGAGRRALSASALEAFLAVCGSGDEPLAPRATLPPVAGKLFVAQWPLYIDRARGGRRPTLEAFEREYHIEVPYREVIAGNHSSSPRSSRSSNVASGWGGTSGSSRTGNAGLMREASWIEPMHRDRLPSVRDNLLRAFRNPFYDPGSVSLSRSSRIPSRLSYVAALGNVV